jgi:hypothetical protein
MFNNIRSLYGALGAMLFLIAMYLVLENYIGAREIITAGGGQTVNIFKTLQGR